jgi:hypothetical protein
MSKVRNRTSVAFRLPVSLNEALEAAARAGNVTKTDIVTLWLTDRATAEGWASGGQDSGKAAEA